MAIQSTNLANIFSEYYDGAFSGIRLFISNADDRLPQVVMVDVENG